MEEREKMAKQQRGIFLTVLENVTIKKKKKKQKRNRTSF